MSSVNNTTNLLYGCNGEVSSTIPTLQSYTLAITMFLIILTSIFGNCLIIISIYRFKNLQTPTNALLCSLAITDLLGPIIRLSSLALALLFRRWVFGCPWCIASSIFGNFFSASSINHLCLISLERCITIRYPFRSQEWITKSRVFIAIAAVWAISLLMASLPLFGIASATFNKELLDCEIDLQGNKKLGRILLGAVYFLLPVIIMIVVYILIFAKVRTQLKQIMKYTVGSKEDKQRTKMQSELKAVFTVVIVIGFFFLLYLPYFITGALKAYHPTLVAAWWKTVSFTLAYLNSCCNWIVYGVRNKQMRKSFCVLLKFKKFSNNYSEENNNNDNDAKKINNAIQMQMTDLQNVYENTTL